MFSNCIWSTFDLVTLFFRNRIIGNFFFQVYGLKIGVFLPTDFFVTYCICTVGLWNGFAITRAWTEKVHNGLKIKILSMNEHYIYFQCITFEHITDTQWRHKSKRSEKLGRCGRQNMLWPYLKIWEWEWIFGRAVKAISSLGVRSPWRNTYFQNFWTTYYLM